MKFGRTDLDGGSSTGVEGISTIGGVCIGGVDWLGAINIACGCEPRAVPAAGAETLILGGY